MRTYTLVNPNLSSSCQPPPFLPLVDPHLTVLLFSSTTILKTRVSTQPTDQSTANSGRDFLEMNKN